MKINDKELLEMMKIMGDPKELAKRQQALQGAKDRADEANTKAQEQLLILHNAREQFLEEKSSIEPALAEIAAKKAILIKKEDELISRAQTIAKRETELRELDSQLKKGAEEVVAAKANVAEQMANSQTLEDSLNVREATIITKENKLRDYFS